MGTPIRVPNQGCDIDDLRRFVEAKFGRVDAQLKQLQDNHHEEQEGAGKWRALMEQRFNWTAGSWRGAILLS